MPENKVASEVAEIEFDRFADYWDLDTDTDGMDEDDREGFNSLKRRLVRKICSGDLSVDDEGDLEYTLKHPLGDTLTTISYKIPTGNALLTFDKYKDRQQVHKLNAFMGSCTGQNPAIFARMNGADLKICQAVAQLFLGS